MSLESGLFSLITTDAGVAALMGTRLYPSILPQDAVLPAGTYQRIAGPVGYAHDGEAGVDFVLMQVSLFDDVLLDLIALREAVRSAVSGYRGTVASETFDGVRVMNQLQDFDVDTTLYVVHLDLMVPHRSGA